jgi:branched-subunit amino acid ABC-type transport system permease component
VTPATFLAILVSGLSGAALLFLVGAGLTLVFGALRLINLAHGSLYMVGAFVAVALVGALAGALGFAVALVAASIAVGVLGGLIETAVLRRLYRRDHLMQLVATFALILVIDGLVRVIFGNNFHRVAAPGALTGSIGIGSSSISVYQLFLMGVASAVAALLWLVVFRTRLGLAIRAAVADSELLRLAGVNVPLLFTSVFVIGSLLAGLAGAVVAPYQTVTLGIDVDIVVQAFAVTIIGGLGSLRGALVGALAVGLVQSFGIYAAPQFAQAFIFAVMAIVLIVRPWGLFGQPER